MEMKISVMSSSLRLVELRIDPETFHGNQRRNSGYSESERTQAIGKPLAKIGMPGASGSVSG